MISIQNIFNLFFLAIKARTTFFNLSVIIFLFSFQFSNCANDKKKLFDDCMSTFSDADKCESMVNKKDKQEPAKVATSSSTPKNDNLKIRSEMKSALQSKNKLFVIKYLGDPDSRSQDASGEEYFTYTRPVSKYSEESEPDVEVKIYFRRGGVERVVHTAPSNANIILKLLEKKK